MDINKVYNIIFEDSIKANRKVKYIETDDDEFIEIVDIISKHTKTNPIFVKNLFDELLEINCFEAFYLIINITNKLYDEIISIFDEELIFVFINNDMSFEILSKIYVEKYDLLSINLKERLLTYILSKNNLLESLINSISWKNNSESVLYFNFPKQTSEIILINSIKVDLKLLTIVYKDLDENFKLKLLNIMFQSSVSELKGFVKFIIHNYNYLFERFRENFDIKLIQLANIKEAYREYLFESLPHLFNVIPNPIFYTLIDIFTKKTNFNNMKFIDYSKFINEIDEDVRLNFLNKFVPRVQNLTIADVYYY